MKNFSWLNKRLMTKTLSKHESLTISLVAHLAIGMAFGAWYTREKMNQPENAREIVFELVEKVAATPSNRLPSSAIAGTDIEHPGAPASSARSSGVKSSTSKKLVAENVQVNKKTVMMASLTALSDLREKFRFAVQQVAADSVGAFTPVAGAAPNTKVIAAGLGDGLSLGERIRAGLRGGGGKCSPPILK